LLAGRKLLLADDSITIQKVVDLTFADEGVSVVCVNNGREAIERLNEFAPDVILADVFMPQVNGYELCEYIKQNNKLKHIPVMLLVGSFEPFDEEEARRVGADDTLTKPFQSIRRLIEKVGLLTSKRPPEEQIPTAELPKPEGTAEPEPEKLTPAELEISTADTLRLPAELRHHVDAVGPSQPKREEAEFAMHTNMDGTRENRSMESSSDAVDAYEGAGEVLLDLGEIDTGRSFPADDFVLDIDLDATPEPSPADPAFQSSAFRSRDAYKSVATAEPSVVGPNWSVAPPSDGAPAATPEQMATTEEFPREIAQAAQETVPEGREVGTSMEQPHVGGVAAEPYSPATTASPTGVSPQQLSPEMIDAIARRAVEQLSEKVVQEIAWEVVPQLAELLIKRQLEEKSS
jgi:CheY-like chemotaxis protein